MGGEVGGVGGELEFAEERGGMLLVIGILMLMTIPLEGVATDCARETAGVI